MREIKQIKNGKKHHYWSVVENRRVFTKRTVKKALLYLGEITATITHACPGLPAMSPKRPSI